MFRCRRLVVICLCHFGILLSSAAAQEAGTADNTPNANNLMADAVELYREAEDASGQQRLELFRQVGGILDLIKSDFPDSVPAQFMNEGKSLGPINMAVIAAANEATYLDELPQTTVSSVFKVSRQACHALAIEHCEQELAEALFEYITVLAFDLDRASNVEQLSWLFSNPGQFDENLARVNAFDELMSDEVFRDDFINRVNGRVMADLGVEITADVAFSLLTGVVSETLAQHYETQGYQKAADFTRTWMEPIVDISLVLEGASSASTAGAGVGAALIWAKNTYAFWQLGEKQLRAEQSGATADQQLDRLAAEIDSYTRTLISGRLTGVAFEGNEGAPLTERHAEVIKSVLEDHYEMQQYWLRSDDAVLLETFDAVLQAARAFYVTLGRLAEPTPLDAADGSGALPADLQGMGLQPAPDGYLRPPTSSGVNSIASTGSESLGLLGTFQSAEHFSTDRIAASGYPFCAKNGDQVPLLIEPDRISYYESSCRFPNSLLPGQTEYTGSVICSGEGETWDESLVLRLDGDELHREARGYSEILNRCDDNAVTGASSQGDDWGPEIVSREALALGYLPCGDRTDIRACLAEKGVNERAIEFSMRADPDRQGLVFASSFVETGEVDLAETQFIGNTVYYSPVLLNGEFGIHEINFTRDLRNYFRESASQSMLNRYPKASSFSAMQVSAHRILEDGTQRFVLIEQITDGCRVCEVLGSAVTFIEVWPNTGSQIVRRPVGMLLNDWPDDEQMSAAILASRPQALQVRLNSLGYDAGAMDGVLGAKSRLALTTFQAEHCLSPTGRLDTDTLDALVGADGFEAPCARGKLDSNAELTIAEQVLSCDAAEESGFPQSLFSSISSTGIEGRVLYGRTVSGSNWNLRLWAPGNAFGGATFTNSEGETSEGFWRPTPSGMCQSYDDRSSWVCHSLHVCGGDSSRFAMRNANNDLTSVITLEATNGENSTPRREADDECDRDATCFFDRAVTVAQSSGDAELLASTQISIASEMLKIGDASRVAEARAAAAAYFSDTSEPDFRIVVDLGALIAADGDQAGSLRLARQYGAHQVDNAVSQISGKLHWFFGRHEQSLFFLEHINSAVYRDGVFEREAIRLGQDADLSGARSFIARMSRPSSRASVLAQLSQESFRRGDFPSGQSLLNEAILEDAQVARGGNEDKDIARALVLSGDTPAAMAVLNKSDGNWIRYTTGHTAAGLAEIGDVDMAMNLARRLSIFREYGSKVALDEIFNALQKAGRYSDFENFANTLPDNGKDVALSLLTDAYAEDGKFPEAAALVAQLSSPYEQHWANISIARSYTRSGNLVAANSLVGSAGTSENRAGMLIEIGSQLLETSSELKVVNLPSIGTDPTVAVRTQPAVFEPSDLCRNVGPRVTDWGMLNLYSVRREIKKVSSSPRIVTMTTEPATSEGQWAPVTTDDGFNRFSYSFKIEEDRFCLRGIDGRTRCGYAAVCNDAGAVVVFGVSETPTWAFESISPEVSVADLTATSNQLAEKLETKFSANGDGESTPETSAFSAAASSADEGQQVSDQEETAAALYARINGDDLANKLIAATIWGNSSVERELLQELTTISGADFRRLGDLEKLSRLIAIVGMIEDRAGVPAGSMELLNRVRNVRSGQHPTRDEVLRDSRWSLNEKKDFHVINIADPSRVEKYTRPEGAEAVFYNDPSGGWTILSDGVNDATFNLVPDVPFLSNGYVNDNYQHLVLDIIPWAIWGATERDTTSISQRLALFENSLQYKHLAQKGFPLLSGLLPDGDPIATNDSSEKVDIRTASAPELAALLRAFGVTAENVSFVGGDVVGQSRDMEQLIVTYQTDPPVVATPDLPVSAGYDSANGVLSACMARDVLFPTDMLIGGESFGAKRAASIVMAPSDPITGLGALPALCSVDMSRTLTVEAAHGRGELERFGLTNPRGLFVRFRMSAAEASEFLPSLQDGTARLGVDCEMKTMIKKPYTAVPYDYERIGTCVPKSMTLRAYNFETGDQKFMQFSAGGTVFQPTSGVVQSTTPQPTPDPAVTAVAQTRAMWSFKVDGNDEAAVRDLVEGLEGTVAEVILGYENAYPFQTAPTKKLAVRVFQALPEEEVATRAGTERGYGSFVVKSWSHLNNFYFIDDPSSGLANAVIGTIDAMRILSVRELAASSCEWSVTYRIWLRDMTPFGTALASSSASDGFTFEACFRTTREGYDIESYNYVDPS